MFSNERASRNRGRERPAIQLTLITRMGKELPWYRSSGPQDMQQERGYREILQMTLDFALCREAGKLPGPDILGT